MKECCENCRYSAKLVRWDYSNVMENGVVKETVPGYVCTVFGSDEENTVINMIGIEMDSGKCEMFQEKKCIR